MTLERGRSDISCGDHPPQLSLAHQPDPGSGPGRGTNHQHSGTRIALADEEDKTDFARAYAALKE
jgi:hypothetical protein